MARNNSNHIVRSEVTETAFGFYSDEEIKNLSYCKIISPVTHDALGNALAGGLYDTHMGPSDQQSPNCITCGQIYMNCPGHPGHIELCVPVYHPMLFPNMFSLLRTKCSYCHTLRIAQSRTRQTLVKLKLLEMGQLELAKKLDDMMVPPTKENLLEQSEENIIDQLKRHEERVERQLRQVERNYETFKRIQAERKKKGETDPTAKQSNYIKQEQRAVLDAFYKLAIHTKKCENCGAFSLPLRKDGFSKIFQRPLQKRLERTMTAMRMKLKSGLETVTGKVRTTDDATESEEEDVEEEDDTSGEDASTDSDDDNKAATSTPAAKARSGAEADKYLVPLEVEAQLKLLWLSPAQPLLSYVWSRAVSGGQHYHKEEYRLFFVRTVLVPPNRFRPPSLLGDITSEHPQNQQLSKVLSINEKIANMNGNGSASDSSLSDKGFTQVITAWIELQNCVNCYMDSAKDPNPLGGSAAPPGIRQLLERKEGLFRHHMMGKRVNYCCRSVISPDPLIGTDEIGIPLRFAKTLQYPVPVTSWNVKYLQQLVENGPQEYPGANQIEMPDGKVIKLDKFTRQERVARALLLTSQPGIKVYRHLITGDALLVNRQPTLHKPGIMCHKARILTHMKEQTLRMNYANCNTYNADFDGDEMNCHFVQDEVARSEAYNIMNCDNQYIVPTSGNPLRGLIQDHVASAVKLTCKNTFLNKSEFQQLVYSAVCGLPGTEVTPFSESMITDIPPTIYKPQPLWTGKQVVTALLAHLIRPPLHKLHLDGKTRTPGTAMGVEQQEHVVIIRYGELLSGVMDKSAIGNASFGIVHSVYELYGPRMAGLLLSAFGRLFSYYLQTAGHTCGIEDLTLTAKSDAERRQLLAKVQTVAAKSILGYAEGSDNLQEFVNNRKADVSPNEIKAAETALEHMIAADRVGEKQKLDATMQGVINKSASEILKTCLPGGLEVPFLRNNFSMMVMTGAKGSGVNQSQISCFLGQQALEGQRVPVMISGKTLPSFKPYDSSPRAGGFVQDRFLTGVKPQEYYFHCMAGREGLVDTAVKTSRSGYLQRCLVKHLEELKVGYDMTVRDSAANVVQFNYGEDGLDPTQAAYIGSKSNQMLFLARNHKALIQKYNIDNSLFNNGLEMTSASDFYSRLQSVKKLMRDLEKDQAKSSSGACSASTSASSARLFKKGSVVLVRTKKSVSGDRRRENLGNDWETAEVVKARLDDIDSSAGPRFDLRFVRNGVEEVEKKVPLFLVVPAREGFGGVAEGTTANNMVLRVPLIRAGLPTETAMSKLQLGSAVGACSEIMQDKIQTYVSTNPDNVIAPKGQVPSETQVAADAFELLVWIKFMRSLANPGEAVGCVAAQSVGEPSTQMTLNTFHLAGHGGANVTLGIPRLREIIMTASKNLKTPTMLLPMVPDSSLAQAKLLARRVDRLSLHILLDHNGGVEVGERLMKNKLTAAWERQYRVRLHLQPVDKIKAVFGVGFDEVAETVKMKMQKQLLALIQLEKRRVGEKKADLIVSRKAERDGKAGSAKDGDDEGEAEAGGAATGGKKGSLKTMLDGEDSDADDNDEANADEKDAGATKISAQRRDDDGSDDDEEEDEEEGLNRKVSPTQSDYANIANDSDASDSDAEMDADAVDDSAIARQGKKKSGKRDETLLCSKSEGWIEFVVTYPATARRLLMAQLVEQAARRTTVHATKDITTAYGIKCGEKEEGVGVQVEGINFEAMWELSPSLVDHNQIKSNDIYHILQTYGVEAARQSIVSEILGVFGVYGIDVNARHLNLIADYMTRMGTYIPMNRAGMEECPSPYLQMSFETTCGFLNKAAQEGLVDNMESSSSRIVLGSIPKVGTGCFDLMVPLGTTK